MLIDTHCHLDFSEFNPDRNEVIMRARGAGVEYIINVASSLENSYASVALSREYLLIFSSVGVHPHDAKYFSQNTLKEISELANNEKVVAIGEVGLDFYRNLSERDVQEKVFIEFVRLARQKSLPLILHCRDASDDLLRILKSEYFTGMRGVVHCFSGDEKFLRECLNLGFLISFTCNITYKKSDNLREIIKAAPLNKIMLETDAPYLSPEGFRGKRNEPIQVKLLAEKIAEIKKMKFDEIAKATTENAKLLFGFK